MKENEERVNDEIMKRVFREFGCGFLYRLY